MSPDPKVVIITIIQLINIKLLLYLFKLAIGLQQLFSLSINHIFFILLNN